MIKKFIFLLYFVVGILINIPALAESKQYGDCAKGDMQCEKEEKKGMADDRRRYEKWCKQHPGQCSKKIKMF